MIAFSSTLVFHVFFTFYLLYFYLSFSFFITLFFCSFLFLSFTVFYFTFRYSFTLCHFMFLLLYSCFSFIYVRCSFPLLSFCCSFTCVFLVLHFRLVVSFSCSSLLKLRTSFLDQNSFHNSYLVNLVCVVLIIIHILYTTLAEHWSKTRLLPRDIRLGCRPDLSSKVGEKRSTATCSFTEKLAAHPGSLPMSNLYIQWDLTWGVQGLWRHIAAKGPHSVQERKSSESWLETRKDKKEWKKLGKKAHNCINTCLTASLFRLLPAVPMRPSKTSHLGWCEVSIDGWKSLSKLLKESMKSKIQKDHEKVLLAAIWPVQA